MFWIGTIGYMGMHGVGVGQRNLDNLISYTKK